MRMMTNGTNMMNMPTVRILSGTLLAVIAEAVGNAVKKGTQDKGVEEKCNGFFNWSQIGDFKWSRSG